MVTSALAFLYITLRIHSIRRGFYIRYIKRDDETSSEFDYELFRDSVLKSVESGLHFFVIGNLIVFVLLGDWAFDPKEFKGPLILFIIVAIFHFVGAVRKFVQEKGKA
jgi:hypothetical protein